MNKLGHNIVIEVKNLKFTFPSATEPILKGINLEIYSGELTLIVGPTGSGKSTLLQTFNGIIPHLSSGKMEGEVIVDGLNTKEHEVYELSSHIGSVFQDPDAQIFSIRVEDEIAFGLENLGFSFEEMEKRINQAVEWVGLKPIFKNITIALSGGQKQKVSIASSLAMLPKIIILDGPITDLDPVSKQLITSLLFDLKTKLGITLVIAEHDFSKIIEITDRIIVLNNGEVVLDGNPKDIIWNNYKELENIGIIIPQHIELMHFIKEKGYALKNNSIYYQDVLKYIRNNINDIININKIELKNIDKYEDNISISFKDLWFAYRKNEYILKGLNANIHEGEFIAIIGPNGSGKSTWAKTMIGLLKPSKGEIKIYGKNTENLDMNTITKYIGFLFQNPGSQLFANSVQEEMEFGLKIKEIDPKKISVIIDETLNLLGLSAYKKMHPFSLSRGEKKRLAAASVLQTHPNIVVLDEPTTGQDRKNLFGLMNLMKNLNEKGGTIIMITHDMQLVAEYADRVIVIKDGKIELDGSPRDVFYKHFEQLEEWNLSPPTVPRISYELKNYNFPMLLRTDEFQNILK